MTTMTTVGYGDVRISTDEGKVVAMPSHSALRPDLRHVHSPLTLRSARSAN